MAPFHRLASIFSTLRTRLAAPYKGEWIGDPLRVAIFTAKFICFAHLTVEYSYTVSHGVGPSMLPTFEVIGDCFVVSHRHRFGRDVMVGDIVVYNIPVNNNNSIGVKRVLGMPGDYVLTGTPHSYHSESAANTRKDLMLQVPPGHCWVVGDNITASRDSRIYGPVPLALIRGKVVATVKSPFDFQWMENSFKKVDDDDTIER
ncbi:peptidase S24/S26A/S26B/S26C [Apodospora peruviana]|uniref:Mitochondrial inner membrane protease subunit n=1 Tax=Apodospora peruviana TaxID=516989 RepID=A0AAE0IJX5_9PEZI|nr:peptidase S24/S26A/S26B/S26C [Apodospora peruviana]